MKHTPAPPNPSRRQQRGGQALFNKKRERELKAMAADQVRPGVARFRPAARRARHDGWTPERQRHFIEVLAETGCVTQAAEEVGMSRRSAYALRKTAAAHAFRFAWDIALDHANQVMADNATSRAVNGTTVTKLFQGEIVHQEVRFDETFVMRMLASRDPYRFGRNPDLARSELHREAAAEAMQKAVALIDTELVSTKEGQLSLADARQALEQRLKQAEQEDATAAKKVDAARENVELRECFASIMSAEELARLFPDTDDPDGDPDAEPEMGANRQADQASAQAREDCELPPAAPVPEPAPPRRRAPSVRQL